MLRGERLLQRSTASISCPPPMRLHVAGRHTTTSTAIEKDYQHGDALMAQLLSRTCQLTNSRGEAVPAAAIEERVRWLLTCPAELKVTA